MTPMPIMTLDEMAARIADGSSVSIHKGDEADVPMALMWAMVRRGLRDLHVVTLPTAAYPVSGMMMDILIGAGCVASVETSGISLHELGAAPRFSSAVKSGALRVVDATCPAVYAGLNAGAKGQPFAPLRGLIGSDVQAQRNDYKIIDNPYIPGDRIVVVPAINPDVAIFHAEAADAEGNVWVGRDRDRILAAHAARQTLITVERVVEGSFFDDPLRSAGLVGAMHVNGIAVAPQGSWPLRADGSCDLDEVRRYQRAAQSEEGFAQYVQAQLASGVSA